MRVSIAACALWIMCATSHAESPPAPTPKPTVQTTATAKPPKPPTPAPKPWITTTASIRNNTIEVDISGVYYGIVKVRTEGSRVFADLCADALDDNGANVVCRQNGFFGGRLVPPGTFGRIGGYYHYYEMLDRQCVGTEPRLDDCPRSVNRPKSRCTSWKLTHYAAVVCYRSSGVSFNDSFTYKVATVDAPSPIGQVVVTRYGLEGAICADKWTDSDATVVCRTLYPSTPFGMAMTFNETKTMPYLLSGTNCADNATSLNTCPYDRTFTPCAMGVYDSGYAGVLCYKTVPSVALVGGKSRRGRVQITYNGVAGSMCQNNSKYAAEVVCTMMSFEYGEYIPNPWFGNGSGPVYIDGSGCLGYEKNIYQCQHNGWNQPLDYCSQHGNDTAVVCYSHVKLYNVARKKGMASGLVHVYSNNTGEWDFVCKDTLDINSTLAICSELEYDTGVKIPAGLFDVHWSPFHDILNVTCPGGSTDLSNCSRNVMRDCYDYGAVMCYDHGTVTHGKLELERTDPPFNVGNMKVTQFGVHGYICPSLLTDLVPELFCKGLGYTGGYLFYDKRDRKLSNVKYTMNRMRCTENSTDLYNCTQEYNEPCFYKDRVGKAYCYNSKPELMLHSTTGDPMQGELRLKFEGTVGRVCQPQTRNTTAKVACRHLGYIYGRPLTGTSRKNLTSSMPMWFSSLYCSTGSESTLFKCNYTSLNATSDPACTSTFNIQCYYHVMIGAGRDKAGVVYVYVSSSSIKDYRLVCQDNVNDMEATTICRGQGYKYGKAIYGSMVGWRSRWYIRIQRLKCPATAEKLSECSYDTYGRCASGHYLSVACSNVPTDPNGDGYTIELSSGDHGLVQLTYFDNQGFICGDYFTKADATVVCREKGYVSGIAYRTKATSAYMIWLSKLSCGGDEKGIRTCNRTAWGNLTQCSGLVASVVCYSAHQAYETQTIGPIGRDREGRLEMSISDTWATVCSVGFTNREATVACRERGFMSGRVIDRTYGKSLSKYVLWGLRCKGTEKELADCSFSGFEPSENSKCAGHASDVSIFCYDSVRLNGGTFYNYGRLEILTDAGVWAYLTDQSSTPSFMLHAYYIPNVRLNGGTFYNYGRLEILTDAGVWAYLTDQSINAHGAKVVCKAMGFQDGIMQCCSPFYGMREIRNIRMAPVQFECYKEHKEISRCKNMTFINKDANQVNLLCTEKPVETKVKIEDYLDKGYHGPIRMYQGGVLKYVCPAMWSDTLANVTCKQLKFAGGVATYAQAATLEKPFFIGEFSCTGQESSFDKCAPMKVNNASVKCRGISRPGFTDVAVAASLCYRNGYSDGYHSTANMTYTKPASPGTPVYVTNVRCSGSERSLLQCQHKWVKGQNMAQCNSSYDLPVTCFRKVRIVRGNGSYGIVQIANKDHKWRTVCSDGFTDVDAGVACKPNYENGMSVCCGSFGYNFMPVEHTQVKCTGKEAALYYCPHKTLDIHDMCARTNYSAVVCYNGTRPTSYNRIYMFGTSKYTGSIRIDYMGINGSICSDLWDDKAAAVACRELNFAGGQRYIHFREKYVFHKRYGPYWASKVICDGTEKSLSECTMDLGRVSECKGRHHAGVLCYSAKPTDTEYRLTGSNLASSGRVEVRVNGVWGSVCHTGWPRKAAKVLCVQNGYADGVSVTTQYPEPPDVMYQPKMKCKGTELNLRDCPHGGWQITSLAYCNPAAVVCFKGVALQTGHLATHGPLIMLVNSRWRLVCDTDFNDQAAKLACIDMGFNDGKAVCCSAYGTGHFRAARYAINTDVTVSCSNADSSINDCIVRKPCNSKNYASVICNNSTRPFNDSISFHIEKQFENRGHIVVNQFGIQGRVCSPKWDDRDAQVACREAGFKGGAAYSHFTLYERFDAYKRGPFLVGHFQCDGSEGALRACGRKDRLNLGDCSEVDVAGVMCYNDDGIKYFIEPTNPSVPDRGRVIVQVDGINGSVCDTFWSNRDANVFCSSMGYGGGVTWQSNKRVYDRGPIWLSHLLCYGNETDLHSCPHRGFNISIEPVILVYVNTGKLLHVRMCTNHTTDAHVRCLGHLRLSRGPDAKMGALEKATNQKWNTICDNNWNDRYAELACRQLNFKYGLYVPHSAFDNSSELGPTQVKYTCGRRAMNFSQCKVQQMKQNCSDYASVYCLDEKPKKDFAVRLAKDEYSGSYYGMIEVNMGGVWGRVCSVGWTDENSNVTCRTMGFAGGRTYLHVWNEPSPIVMRNVKCRGNEVSLGKCKYAKWSSRECHYSVYPAGVLCYHSNVTKPYFELVGGVAPSAGRVEFIIDGKRGKFCDYSWDAVTAGVVCRELGHVDGMSHKGSSYGVGPPMTWLNVALCKGHEKSLLTCVNSGWESDHYADVCRGASHTASVSCYTKPMKIMSVRLRYGRDPSDSFGRVEVYVRGPGLWGTVCDDDWDDTDAKVVCRQLGYGSGEATKRSASGPGEGPVWTSAVNCRGNESSIADCDMTRLGTTKCKHFEDAGVLCSDPFTTTIKTTPTTTPLPAPPTPQPTRIGSQGPNLVLAILLPIIFLLIIAIIIVILYFMWRRRYGPFAHKRLEEDPIKFHARDDFVNVKSVVTPHDINGVTEITNPDYDRNVYTNIEKQPVTDFQYTPGYSNIDAGYSTVADPGYSTVADAGFKETSLTVSDDGYANAAVNPMFGDSNVFATTNGSSIGGGGTYEYANASAFDFGGSSGGGGGFGGGGGGTSDFGGSSDF